MRIDVLGSVRVDGGVGALSPRDRRVLAALVVAAGEELPAEALADVLWDDPPASAVKVVQGCVSRLRRALGPDTIETRGSGYALDADRVDIDVVRFEALIEQARHERDLGRSDLAEQTLTTALGLWRGRPAEELEGWGPAQAWLARWKQERLDAQEELVAAQLARGAHDRAVGVALVLAEEEPWRERRWALLALAQYRCGRQADALATLRRARSALAGQLGVDPGPDLVDLESAILQQDPTLMDFDPVSAVRGDDECPYPGLEAYDVDDAALFFGRTESVDRLVERLGDTGDPARVIVLVGDSGTGKSSILRAGIVARLRAAGREVALCVPGDDPLTAARTALAASGDGAVLAVDQLEESLGSDRTEAWLTWLAGRARDVAPVVATLRSDHVGRLAGVPAFAELAEPGLHLVQALHGDALREAIEGPALAFGLSLEPGLVELVLRDSRDEPGAQPLMSHALAETWRERDGRTLTVAGYAAVGGISGAVARTAERVHEALDDADRSRLRSIMLRLSSIESGTPTRVRVPLSVFDGSGRRVVELLVRSRLVTAGDDTVELAHESLIQAWPRLRDWLDEDAVGMRIWRHLSRSAAGWDELGRPESELYRGGRLQVATEWRKRTPGTELSSVEVDFLAASVALADRERTETEARQRDQARSNVRLRRLLIGATAALVVALVSGFLAVDRSRDATAARRASDHTALIQTSLGMRSTDREAAALLALEAYRADPDESAYGALLGTFTGAPGFLGRTFVTADEFLEGTLVPGAERAVVAVGGSDLRLLDLASGTLSDHFDQPAVAKQPYHAELAVSADGSTLAVLSMTSVSDDCATLERFAVDNNRACTTLAAYRIGDGRRIFGPIHPEVGGGGDVAVSPDGRHIAIAGGADGQVEVYSRAGRRLGFLPGQGRPETALARRDTGALAFDDAGDLWAGSLGGLRHIDLPSVTVDRTLDVPTESTHNGIALAGDTLVGSGDSRLVGVDLRTGRLRWQVDVDDLEWPCPYLAASALVHRFYCADFNGGTEERSVDTGQLTGRRFDPQDGDPGDLAVGRDGTELVSFSAIRPMYSRWRLDGSGPVSRPFGGVREYATDYPDPQGLVPMTVLDADGSAAHRTLVRDVATGEVVAQFPGYDLGYWFGDQLVLEKPEGGIRIRDLDLTTATPLDASYVQTTQDGSLMLVDADEDDPDLRVVETATGTVRRSFRLPEPWGVNNATFSSDGDRVYFSLAQYDGWKQEYRGAWYDLQREKWHILDRGDGGGNEIVTIQVASADTVVTSDSTGGLVVRDADLRAVGRLPGARAVVSMGQALADGRFLAGSADSTMTLFDLSHRRMLADPVAPAFSVDALDFWMAPGWLDAAGDRLIVNGGVPGAMVWDLRPTTLVRAACAVAGRNFTRPEWRTYLGDQPYRRTCEEYPAPA